MAVSEFIERKLYRYDCYSHERARKSENRIKANSSFITSSYDSSQVSLDIAFVVLTNAFISIIFRQDKVFVAGTMEATISIYTGPIWTISIVYFTLIDVFRKDAMLKRQTVREGNYEASVINFLIICCFFFHFHRVMFSFLFNKIS